MFVPVSCTSCGKPFQVPEAALGKLTPCPWCSATVTALPVAAPLSDSQPKTEPAPEPLSLDDAPERSPNEKPNARPALRARPAPGESRPKPGVPTAVIVGAMMLVVMGATILVLTFYPIRLFKPVWTEFTPPDGSFTIALTGQPEESDVEPSGDGAFLGGKRYEVRRWYAGTTAWVAYNDLPPRPGAKTGDDPQRRRAAGMIAVARDREVNRLKGTNLKEGAEVRDKDGWGGEVHMDTPNGPAAVRFVVFETGPRPRLYVYGVRGKQATADSGGPQRIFGSFRTND